MRFLKITPLMGLMIKVVPCVRRAITYKMSLWHQVQYSNVCKESKRRLNKTYLCLVRMRMSGWIVRVRMGLPSIQRTHSWDLHYTMPIKVYHKLFRAIQQLLIIYGWVQAHIIGSSALRPMTRRWRLCAVMQICNGNTHSQITLKLMWGLWIARKGTLARLARMEVHRSSTIIVLMYTEILDQSFESPQNTLILTLQAHQCSKTLNLMVLI